MSKQPLLLYLSLGLLLFTLTGMILEPVSADDDSYKYLSNFSDALDLIQKNYVDVVSLDRLIDGAYRGLLESLDPDSFYLDPRNLKRFQAPRPANPGRIGVDVSKRHGYAVVVSVMPGSPADGKLASGDYIRSIDGQSTREMNLFDIRERLEGPPDKPVKLKVVRRENLETEDLVLTRRVVSLEPLAVDSPEEGYLRLRLLRVDADTVARAARELRAAKATRAVLLDLRGCSLGEVWQGAPLADLFLDGGTIFRLRGKTSEATVKRMLAVLRLESDPQPAPAATGPAALKAEGEDDDEEAAVPRPPLEGYAYRVVASPDDTVWRGPLVVLIDGGTAGASEVAAAALHDAGRAEVLGTRSFGRAAIQDLIPIEGGAALHLTVARILLPSGRSLLGRGLEPDEVVETSRDSAGDTVLDKALERLKSNGRAKKAA